VEDPDKNRNIDKITAIAVHKNALCCVVTTGGPPNRAMTRRTIKSPMKAKVRKAGSGNSVRLLSTVNRSLSAADTVIPRRAAAPGTG
jgi:hypothetical protein